MPISLILALRRLAAVRGYRDPVTIMAEAQDKSPRRAPLAWWV